MNEDVPDEWLCGAFFEKDGSTWRCELLRGHSPADAHDVETGEEQ